MLVISTGLSTTVAFFILAGVWKFGAKALRNHLFYKYTILGDIGDLGSPRDSKDRLKGTAVICGGSIAGLWAARICADHFDKVVIIENEKWLATDEGTLPICDEKGNMYNREGKHERTRVFQADVLHVYQNINFIALRKVFPDIEAELLRRNASIHTEQVRIYVPHGTIVSPSFDQGIHKPEGVLISASRETYEKMLRYFVRKISNVEWMAGTVVDIQCNSTNLLRVENVKARVDHKERPQDAVIPAALVIDCTGSTQAGVKWVRRIHSAISESHPTVNPVPPPYLKYNPHSQCHYFTFNIEPAYRSRLDDLIPGGYENAGWIMSYVTEPDAGNKFVGITKNEGHQVRVLFASYGEAELPQKLDEFAPFFRSCVCKVPFPEWLYQFIDVLVDIDDYSFRSMINPGCSWVQYENATHIPHNFVAIGDSVMCANPLWGQGCSKAIVGAVTLDAILRGVNTNKGREHIPAGFSHTFFDLQSHRTRTTWDGTKPIDYGFGSTTPVAGETLRDYRIQRSFSRILTKLTVKDEGISNRIWRIRYFLAPPAELMYPAVLFRVAWEAFQEAIDLMFGSIFPYART